MKRIIQIAVLFPLVALSGCATPYMIDRGRDAADIFTATVGVGVGAKARVGPLAAGLILESDITGLRGGALHLPDFRGPSGPTSMFPSDFDAFGLLVGVEHFTSGPAVTSERHKTFTAESRWPFIIAPRKSRDWSYYTQIEVSGGILGAARLGFNPGELLDFILGWAHCDIMSDDPSYIREERKRQEDEWRQKRKDKRTSNKSIQATPEGAPD